MYDELVKRLRDAVDGRNEKCGSCPYVEDYPCCVDCLDKMHRQAADAIEELLDFAHFVASNVVVSDEEWDNNMLVFPEVASRKLNKLGIVEKDGAFWSYKPPKEES